MSRQSIVAPIGLYTEPNKYGQYKRGALEIADNVVMRRFGIISSMPNVRTLRASTATTTDRIIRTLMAADSHTFQYVENNAVTVAALAWASASGVQTVSVPSTWEGGATAGCARMARARERFFFTCWSPTITAAKLRAPLVIDSENGSSARLIGLTPPSSVSFNLAGPTTDAQAILADSSASWRVLFRRIQSDGYELVSAPSHPMIGFNPSGGVTRDANIKAWLPDGHTVQAGDLCEVYRTATVDGDDTDPGDVMYLAVTQTVTSTDISNRYIIVLDNCPDASLGVALYTNSGEEGDDAGNFYPGECADMCVFKGHMFYAMPTTPAKFTFGPRNAFGYNLSTNFERLYGIGARLTTGTFTNGSPTITAVVNMRGMVVGQLIQSSNFPGNFATVTAVTATTVTCDANSTASNTTSFTSWDEIRIKWETSEQIFTVHPNLASTVGMIWTSSIANKTDISTFNTYGLPSVMYGYEAIVRHDWVRSDALTVRATNGVNYSPPFPEYGATANTYSPEVKHNRYVWSKFQKPEAVPPLNYGFAGTGKILRLIPTRDALWMFCTDGLYRLSGTGGDGDSAWRLDPADPHLVLAGRNAVTSLGETVYAYTNYGLVSISDTEGVKRVSAGIIGDLIPGAAFADTWDIWMATDEAHLEIWLTFRSGTHGAGSSYSYIFNALTNTFVKFTNSAEYSTAAYAPYLGSLVLGQVVAGSPAGNPNQLYFEADSSTSRVSGVRVAFQPLYEKDPFSLKQFVDVTFAFDGVNATATLTPMFSMVDATARACNQSSGESRATAGVPRTAAIKAHLRPGFKMSDVGAAWSFRGLSARFTPGGEETERD